MSFLKPLLSAGGAGMAGAAATGGANPLAGGLGKLLGTDGAHVSGVADRIGKGMNMIAAGGGAEPGYAAPEIPQSAAPANHLQMMDPNVLQALIARFRPAGQGMQ